MLVCHDAGCAGMWAVPGCSAPELYSAHAHLTQGRAGGDRQGGSEVTHGTLYVFSLQDAAGDSGRPGEKLPGDAAAPLLPHPLLPPGQAGFGFSSPPSNPAAQIFFLQICLFLFNFFFLCF